MKQILEIIKAVRLEAVEQISHNLTSSRDLLCSTVKNMYEALVVITPPTRISVLNAPVADNKNYARSVP